MRLQRTVGNAQRLLIAVIMALLIALWQAPGGRAASHSDTQAPVFVSRSVSPTSVDVTSGAQQVRVSMRFSDETGVERVYFRLASTSTSQSYYEVPQLISGDAANGVWSAVFDLPQGIAPGKWDVQYYGLTDSVGNEGRAGYSAVSALTVVSS